MILVDIYIPSVDKTYDFQINEQSRISTVVEEITEMIGQKERSRIVGDISKLLLCEYSTGSVLDPETTLEQAGIGTGEKLLLV